MPKQNNLNLQDFGPVTSFSTSIISGLLIGLLIQYFIGYEPVPVLILVLLVIYDGSRRMWQISKKLENKQ